jgi:hypothetical protein
MTPSDLHKSSPILRKLLNPNDKCKAGMTPSDTISFQSWAGHTQNRSPQDPEHFKQARRLWNEFKGTDNYLNLLTVRRRMTGEEPKVNVDGHGLLGNAPGGTSWGIKPARKLI